MNAHHFTQLDQPQLTYITHRSWIKPLGPLYLATKYVYYITWPIAAGHIAHWPWTIVWLLTVSICELYLDLHNMCETQNLCEMQWYTDSSWRITRWYELTMMQCSRGQHWVCSTDWELCYFDILFTQCNMGNALRMVFIYHCISYTHGDALIL